MPVKHLVGYIDQAAVTLLAFAQRVLGHILGSFALGDVLNDQHDALWPARVRFHPATVEQHGAAADVSKIVRNLVLVERISMKQNLFEQPPKLGDVPLTVAQGVYHAAFGLARLNLESPIECLVRGDDAQIVVQHQQRHGASAQDGFGIVPRVAGLLVALVREPRLSRWGGIGSAAGMVHTSPNYRHKTVVWNV